MGKNPVSDEKCPRMGKNKMFSLYSSKHPRKLDFPFLYQTKYLTFFFLMYMYASNTDFSDLSLESKIRREPLGFQIFTFILCVVLIASCVKSIAKRSLKGTESFQKRPWCVKCPFHANGKITSITFLSCR